MATTLDWGQPSVELFIFTATKDVDYTWYAVERDRLTEVDAPLHEMSSILDRLAATQPIVCASLFRYGDKDGVRYAICWSGLRTGEVDHIGRAVFATLLVSLADGVTAMQAFAQMLRGWPLHASDLPLRYMVNANTAASAALAANALWQSLDAQLEAWREGEPLPSPSPELRQRSALHARLTQERIDELSRYLLWVARNPQELPKPEHMIEVIALVSEELSPQRAAGCWRRLLGRAGPAEWTPIAGPKPPRPQPRPQPFPLLAIPLRMVEAVIDALWRLFRRLSMDRSAQPGYEMVARAIRQRDYTFLRDHAPTIVAAGRKNPTGIVEPLVEALNSAPDPELQIVLCDLLAKIGAPAVQATATLEQLQQSGAQQVRVRAANALREIRRTARNQSAGSQSPSPSVSEKDS